MAYYEKRFWSPDLEAIGLPRRDRRGGAYSIYVPDPLLSRTISLGGAEAADVADAERAIVELDRTATTLSDTEALARLLLRAESVASSHIEGIVNADEVLANVDAMAYAVAAVSNGEAISSALLRETHRRLLAATHLAEHGGRTRTQQNWIGGSSYNPCSAAFVPPPWEMVDALLDDLFAFCNGDSLPTVAQAAIAHAQFETIHPFIDGNGRVGRVLVHLIFRRRQLTKNVSPPVSLILATRARDYITGLNATRYDGVADSRQAADGLNTWFGTFAAACTRAAKDAVQFELRIRDIQATWRERLGAVRKHSVALRIIELLPGTPFVTLAELTRVTGSSLSSVTEAVARLVEAEIVAPLTVGRKRKQVFQAREIVDAFADLERQLASLAGDMQIATPVRSVPARRTV